MAAARAIAIVYEHDVVYLSCTPLWLGTIEEEDERHVLETERQVAQQELAHQDAAQ